MHRYLTNPNVIHETIDGETIIIDLANGTYYSLVGAGPTIWDAITAGATTAGVVERALEAFEADRAEITPAVEAFLQELENQELIAVTDNGAGAAPVTGERASTPTERLPFVAPRLETYTDMQDIILLDPVHKVDDRGWPHAAETSTA
jgi:hypothetical protein